MLVDLISVGSVSDLCSPSFFNTRTKVLNSDIRSSVKGHYSAVTVEPPTDYYLAFCTKRDTKLVNKTQQSIVVARETLPAAPCTARRIRFLLLSVDPSGLSAN